MRSGGWWISDLHLRQWINRRGMPVLRDVCRDEDPRVTLLQRVAGGRWCEGEGTAP